MHHSDSPISSYVELEKNYDYIYFDKSNKLHILIPITTAIPAGKKIVMAGDNTCKTLTEPEKAFGLKSGVPTLKDNVQNYITDLAFDIWAMDEELKSGQQVPQNLKDKKERLAQLQSSQKIIEETFDYFRNSLSPDFFSYGKYPPEIMKLFCADNQNVVRFELSPEHEDDVTAFNPRIRLFSASRGKESARGLGGALRKMVNQGGLFESKPKKTQKDVLIENCANEYLKKYPGVQQIKDDASLNNLKNIIIQEYNKLSGKTLTLENLNTLSQSVNGHTQANWHTFTTLLYVFNFDGDPVSEAIPTILSSTVPEYFNALAEEISPLSELCSQGKAELLSMNCQLFLAMINAYCYGELGNKNNFGEIIEQKKLAATLAEDIEFAIRKDLLIEDTILNFFSSNHAVFGLNENFPSGPERVTLKKGFREYYQAVQLDSSTHLDEGILCLPEQKTESGCGYIHQSKIVFPFSKILEQKPEFKSLYQTYFMGNSPLLSSTIEASSDLSRRLPSSNLVGNMTKANVKGINIKSLLDKNKYTEFYFINLLIKPILQESDEKYEEKTSKIHSRLHQFLSPENRKLFKSDKRWLKICNGVVAKLGPEEIEIFCKTWDLPSVLHIDASMADVIYSIVVNKDKKKNPLLGLHGAAKLQVALKLLFKVENENIVVRPNDVGGYNVFAERIDQLKTKLMPIYNEARCLIPIPPGMAKSIYMCAQQWAPENKNLKKRGPKLTLSDMENRTFMQNLMSEKRGIQDESLIVQSLRTIHFPFLDIMPNSLNGYWLKVKNQKEYELATARLQAIYEKYYNQLPAVELTVADCDKIFDKAGVGLYDNSIPGICNALRVSLGYAKLHLLVHSMDFRITEDGQIFVRFVVDNSPENSSMTDEGALDELRDIIGLPLRFVLHPSQDPQFNKNILSNNNAELESLERKFDHHIELNEEQQEFLFSKVSVNDEFYLLPFYGAARVLEALSFLDLTQGGQVAVLPDGKSYKLNIENIDDYQRIYAFLNELPFMHLTRSMARSLYVIGKKEGRGIDVLKAIIKEFTDKDVDVDYNDENGYIVKGPFKALQAIKKIHQERFKTLSAIKLTFKQCVTWCEKAGIQVGSGKDKLRKAMRQVIEFRQPFLYRDIPTAFLEVTDNCTVRMVVENDDKGILKIAGILGVDAESLKTEHPAQNEQYALLAEQSVELETEENEIKKNPSLLTSSSASSFSSSSSSDDYIFTAPLEEIKESHAQSFKSLVGIELTLQQCVIWCGKAGVQLLGWGKDGLLNSMKRVVGEGEPFAYRNVSTAFLEVANDCKSVRMLVEYDKNGVFKIAKILNVAPDSLITKLPAQSKQYALSAEQSGELETKEIEIKKNSSSFLSSSVSLFSSSSSSQGSVLPEAKSSVSSTGMFSHSGTLASSLIAIPQYFPVDANFSDEEWPVEFIFRSPKIAIELFNQLQSNLNITDKLDYIQMREDGQGIRFAPAACMATSNIFVEFLDFFDYGANIIIEAAVKDFKKQVNSFYALPISLFPSGQKNGRAERFQKAWTSISTFNALADGFKLNVNNTSTLGNST